MKILSVDLETTGLDPNKHFVLSIGAVCPSTHSHFYVEFDWKELLVCPKAMKVNQIDLRASNPEAKSPEEAMSSFEEWLGKNEIRGQEECRILGKNPTGIDRPMLERLWDKYRGCLSCPVKFPFSHRTVDLNTLFAGLAEANGLDVDKTRKGIEKVAEENIQFNYPGVFELGAHHALWDAYWNVYAWRECLNRIRQPLEDIVPSLSMGGPTYNIDANGNVELIEPNMDED